MTHVKHRLDQQAAARQENHFVLGNCRKLCNFHTATFFNVENDPIAILAQKHVILQHLEILRAAADGPPHHLLPLLGLVVAS